MRDEKAWKWLNENELSYKIWNNKYRHNNESLDEIELYSGNSYSIEKILVDDNQTKLFNQSSILIRPITS